MQTYDDVKYCGEELPKFAPSKYIIVRTFVIHSQHSKYYEAQCQQEMAGADDLAWAFDLRDWYENNFPSHNLAIDYKYEVQER